jgi:hypothetical protein
MPIISAIFWGKGISVYYGKLAAHLSEGLNPILREPERLEIIWEGIWRRQDFKERLVVMMVQMAVLEMINIIEPFDHADIMSDDNYCRLVFFGDLL